MIAGTLATVIGTQVISLGVAARAYGVWYLGERDPWFQRMEERLPPRARASRRRCRSARRPRARHVHRREVARPRRRGAVRNAARPPGGHARDRGPPDLLLELPALDSRPAPQRLTDLAPTHEDVRGPVATRSARSLPTRFRPGLVLGGIMALSFGIRLALALRDPAPWIFHDEMAYSELAKSFGYTGDFAMRDVPGPAASGILYPVPDLAGVRALRLGPDCVRRPARDQLRLVSLTAIPVYLIGRRVAGRWLAGRRGALALDSHAHVHEHGDDGERVLSGDRILGARRRPRLRAADSMAAASRLRLARPGLPRAGPGDRPRPGARDRAGRGRPLDVLADSGRVFDRARRAVVPYWPTLAIFALGAIAVPARQVARGEPLANLLGAYGGITNLGYDWGAVVDYLMYHLADLDILTGVIPFAAFVAFTIWTLRPVAGTRAEDLQRARRQPRHLVRRRGRGVRQHSGRDADRGAEHVPRRPVHLPRPRRLDRHGCPRPWWAVAPAALFAGTITLTLPINSFLNGNRCPQHAGAHADLALARPALQRRVDRRGRLRRGRCRRAGVPPGAAQGRRRCSSSFSWPTSSPRRGPVEGLTHGASLESYRFGVGDAAPDWIDQAADGEDVLSFWFTGSNAVPYWESEFFNRSLKRTYSSAGPVRRLDPHVHVPDRASVGAGRGGRQADRRAAGHDGPWDPGPRDDRRA